MIRSLFSLAGVEGLEPPTSGFGDLRSSQLDYTPRDILLHQYNYIYPIYYIININNI